MGLVSADDFSLFKMCNSVDEAIAEIAQFYKNYHSYRWVGQKMVVRLQRRLTGKSVDSIEVAFDDILNGSCFEQGAALPEEQNEPEIAHLPRLKFTPKRRNFGRLRKLIDAINAAEAEGGGGAATSNIQHPTPNIQ